VWRTRSDPTHACATSLIRSAVESFLPRLTILLLSILFVTFLTACGAAYQLFGLARDSRAFPPPGRMLDVGGYRLHLIESGQGNIVVVFEAGISASCLNWTRVRTDVSQFARAYAYDRASLGWSDRASTPRIASTIVNELYTLLAAAEVPVPFILVGHSFGGLLASGYAAKYPDRVAGLILLDPLAPSEWANPSESRARMLQRGVKLSRRGAMLARIGLVRFALALLSRGARRVPKAIAKLTSGGESVISRLVGEVQKMPPEVWPMVRAHWCHPKSFEGMADYLESLPASSAEAAALALPCSIPVTVLSAKHSTPAQLAERDQMALHSLHGRHIVAADSGHWVHLDQPELVVQAIRDMVDRVPTEPRA
jgi:pimeloyl-ACP methyl ester carboxylesterase